MLKCKTQYYQTQTDSEQITAVQFWATWKIILLWLYDLLLTVIIITLVVGVPFYFPPHLF